MTHPLVTYTPAESVVASSAMTAFAGHLEARAGYALPGYSELQAFAIAEPGRFWAAFLDWSGIDAEGNRDPACTGLTVEDARFFPGLRLSYAEHLLRPLPGGDDARVAVVAYDEAGDVVELSRAELRQRVLALREGLRGLGLCAGDRVVAVARNTPESIIACLAVTSLGAAWASASPDLGIDSLVDRFDQLDPTLLIAHGVLPYQGQRRPLGDKLAQLAASLPSVRAFVALDEAAMGMVLPPTVTQWAAADLMAREVAGSQPQWLRVPFDHPLFILFSSGTTGRPKCIVHGTGGTLLEHVKELRLHCNLGPDDRLLFQTSCGWMMWNWMMSSLACGATVVTYDGSVSHPEPDSLLRIVERTGTTVLGTSPAYLQYLQDAGIVPKERVTLNRLRAILSTGSVLDDRHYDWVLDTIGPLPLQSISGGTDILGCFVLGNPNLPVYRGESQCVSLGLDVRAMTNGDATAVGTGELVCVAPFPSRPVGLVNDPTGERFHEAYFAQHPGIWTHGDVIELTTRGTARILGRSDSTLNIRGIRIGPAEIYRIVLGIDGIVGAAAVEQAAPREPGGSRLVLLVQLALGTVLDRSLSLRIKKELATRASVAHVPAVIADVPELPVTFSGKVSERAIRDALNGREAPNVRALRNPDSLEAIRTHPAVQPGSA